MIFSESFGSKSFNINVDDRQDCMNAIFNDTDFDITGAGESVKNLYGRYQDIQDVFPADITDDMLLHFCDWVAEKVFFIEIVATTEQDAHTIKGWVMDDERLKRGTYLTEKYFDEQLERIREIRASERKFYQKITDLYATAIDYDKNSATTRRFYATVQNKMHYAVHGHTAAELIVERADHTREHMGLTTWADAPEGKIKKSDVTVAKNYLSQDEMKQLNRMVTAYLDFAENMTLRHIPLTMQDWEKRLNSFIEMFDYGILQDAGKVSAEIAKLHAETEFEKYRVIQDRLFMSDFDKYMLELEENAKK